MNSNRLPVLRVAQFADDISPQREPGRFLALCGERVILENQGQVHSRCGVGIAFDECSMNLIESGLRNTGYRHTVGVTVLRGPAMPHTITELFPELRAYCERLLTTACDLSEPHRSAVRQVGDWIHQRRSKGLTANVIVVCTGNSRRSSLGSTLGNVAAAFQGDTGIQFFSGGTAPSAFNPRTIRTLREIGVRIEEQSEVAPPGPAGELNPRYLVSWGRGASDSIPEFSKRYDDVSNPQLDFCAIMVCTDADEHCPVVLGASLRVSMPFEDPKEYDDLPCEAAAYADRRDQIGRAMLLILGQ